MDEKSSLDYKPNFSLYDLLFSNVIKLLQLLWEHYKGAKCYQVDSCGRKYLPSNTCRFQHAYCLLGTLKFVCLHHLTDMINRPEKLSTTPWLTESLKPQTPSRSIYPYLPRISKLLPQTDKTSTFLTPSSPQHKYPTSCRDAHWEETDATAKMYPL